MLLVGDDLQPGGDTVLVSVAVRARGITALAVRTAVVPVRAAGRAGQRTADPLVVGHQTAGVAIRTVGRAIWTPHHFRRGIHLCHG